MHRPARTRSGARQGSLQPSDTSRTRGGVSARDGGGRHHRIRVEVRDLIVSALIIPFLILIAWGCLRAPSGAEHADKMQKLARTVPPSAERRRRERALIRLELAEWKAERQRLYDCEPGAPDDAPWQGAPKRTPL